jgi:RimJ/RimL family protein N-acetyltransferase
MGGKDTRVPFPDCLQTARLSLERPRLEDLPDFDAVMGDPRIGEEQFPARFRGPAENEAFLHRLVTHWDAHGFGLWIVRREGELIGRAGLMTADYLGRAVVEAGWFLSPDHWGHGYATESARAAIDAGFSELGLTEILAWTMPTNLPSQAVMRRLGFVELGPFDRGGLAHIAYAVRSGAQDGRP